MTKRILALLCLLALTAAVGAAENVTLTLTPQQVTLPPGSTQLFTATFSDGSRIRQCTWNATGAPPNMMAPVGPGAASGAFGAGTAPGNYAVTAVCSNVEGVTALGTASVTITQQQ